MRAVALVLMISQLGGCFYYEGGSCDGCLDFDDDWADWGDDDDDDAVPGGDTGSDPDDGTGDDDDLALGLCFFPGEAAQGDVAIGYVTADADLSGAVDVAFFGDLDVTATNAREDEILVAFTVDADAALGPVDLLVTFEDGTAAWLPDAISIVPGAPPDASDDDCACP